MTGLDEIKIKLRGNVSEEEFWTSRAVANYFTDISKAVLEKYGSDFNMKVRIIYKPHGDIAYTTFDEVVLNAACNQVLKILNKDRKLLYLKGLHAHELSHILYMDKQLQKRYFNDLLRGNILPRIPRANGKEKPFLDALKDSKKAQQICQVAKWLCNAIEDGYGENTYLANHYGSLIEGMEYMRREFYNDLPMAKEIEDCLMSDDPKKIWQGVTNTILIYALYHKVKGDDDSLSAKLAERISPIIKKSLECDFKDRLDCLNMLMIELWEYIEPILNTANDQKQNQSSPYGDTDDDENISMPETNKPDHSRDTGNTRPAALRPEQAQLKPFDEKEESQAGNGSGGNGGMCDEEELMEQVVDELAKKELERQKLKQLNSEANDGKTCGCNVTIFRDTEISNDAIEKYRQYSEVLEVSRRIQKVLKQQLDDRRKGGKRSGLYFGRKVEVRQVIRNDGKCFYNNTLPTDIPRICVSVILDESGSMDGINMSGKSRIEFAKDTAVIVEDFCRSLNFPISIIGTTADWQQLGNSELTVYSSFDSVDGNDKYRLMNIQTKQCNRDGAAFAFALQQLQKRPEEIKILFIISDGQPYAYNYGGISAIKELQELNEKAKKSGVVVFAAAIGDDKKQIENIYGDSFLDITDLDILPTMFIDRIKRFIKR